MSNRAAQMIFYPSEITNNIY